MTLRLRRTRSLLAILVGSMVLAACGGSPNGTTSAGQEETVTIGINAELTGDGAASFGIPEQQAFEIVVEDINNSGFLADTKLRLATKDNGTDATKAVTIFNEFAQSGVPIVIESAYTPLLQAIQPFANSEEVVLLSIASGGTGEDEADYVFRMNDNPSVLQVLSKYLVVDRDLKRVAAVVDKQNEATVAIAEFIEQGLIAAGGQKYINELTVQSDETDFSTLLTRLATAQPDAVIVSMAPPQAGNFIKQAQVSGQFDGVVFAGHPGWSIQVAQVAGSAANGAVFPQMWVPGQAGSEAFVEAYSDRWQEQPSAYAGVAHDALWLIASAIKRITSAGDTVTGAALKDELPAASESEDFKDHALVEGFSLPANGAAKVPGALATFKDGQVVPVPGF